MSVDFYACDCCGESRYEEYVDTCHECGHRVCTSCVVDTDNIDSRYAYYYGVKFDGTQEQRVEYGMEDENRFNLEIGEIIDDTGIAPKYCPFCSGEEVNNDDLLVFLLNKYDLEKDDVEKEYLAAKEKK
ncbi:hypothetical protein [Paenibacillus tianjinensis]|uniref:B box-type domain-containing protein n=1 Tax=Paenibacillus tianjinensis TaxID=2810347 RepID=A0ABX7L5L5_9BACL|nr:hypothetical protein [Paenibacillus tianjinensis]QSF43385.1 hypothetical protein JRJ22_19150 [Paenibacillus tianjinensis]